MVAALREEGYTEDRIERVGHLKLGFDIRAQHVIDEMTGEVHVKRIEAKGRARRQPVRLTSNEWCKSQQLSGTCWLDVVWDSLGESSALVRIKKTAVRLDHTKRGIVAARFFEIPAVAVAVAGRCEI